MKLKGKATIFFLNLILGIYIYTTFPIAAFAMSQCVATCLQTGASQAACSAQCGFTSPSPSPPPSSPAPPPPAPAPAGPPNPTGKGSTGFSTTTIPTLPGVSSPKITTKNPQINFNAASITNENFNALTMCPSAATLDCSGVTPNSPNATTNCPDFCFVPRQWCPQGTTSPSYPTCSHFCTVAGSTNDTGCTPPSPLPTLPPNDVVFEPICPVGYVPQGSYNNQPQILNLTTAQAAAGGYYILPVHGGVSSNTPPPVGSYNYYTSLGYTCTGAFGGDPKSSNYWRAAWMTDPSKFGTTSCIPWPGISSAAAFLISSYIPSGNCSYNGCPRTAGGTYGGVTNQFNVSSFLRFCPYGIWGNCPGTSTVYSYSYPVNTAMPGNNDAVYVDSMFLACYTNSSCTSIVPNSGVNSWISNGGSVPPSQIPACSSGQYLGVSWVVFYEQCTPPAGNFFGTSQVYSNLICQHLKATWQ